VNNERSIAKFTHFSANYDLEPKREDQLLELFYSPPFKELFSSLKAQPGKANNSEKENKRFSQTHSLPPTADY
jgi:hypothetical protein